MTLAAISLGALILTIALSCVSKLNVGLVAIFFAWVIGVLIAGRPIEDVLAGFPASLFLTLVALTLLFTQAQLNGTLHRIAGQAVRLCGAHRGLLPLVFFAMTALLSALGAGNIAATALMAPLGMAVAGTQQLSPFLMAIMIANGASAGSLSPITTTGVVVNTLAARMGVDAPWSIFFNNFLVHAAVVFGGYMAFGGMKLFRRGQNADLAHRDTPVEIPRFETAHWLTAAVIASVALAALWLGVPIGMAALAGALLLAGLRVGDDVQAIAQLPWGVILMVTGVSVLVSLMEKTGGIALFTDGLARFSTPSSSTFVAALLTGAVSIYSSTTGVVLPALLPVIPRLIERIGGGDPLALISAMSANGHLVDVSPLSTLGALCLANAPPGTDTRQLFNRLMAWGVSICLVGAVLCWAVFR